MVDQEPSEPLEPIKRNTVTMSQEEFNSSFRVGFQPPPVSDFTDSVGYLECPQEHQNLEEMPGSPWINEPKMIHGMRICDRTNQVLYLCSW